MPADEETIAASLLKFFVPAPELLSCLGGTRIGALSVGALQRWRAGARKANDFLGGIAGNGAGESSSLSAWYVNHRWRVKSELVCARHLDLLVPVTSGLDRRRVLARD